MDGLKPAGSRAFDVRKNIIEEKNALSGYSNRFNDKLECLRIGVSRPVPSSSAARSTTSSNRTALNRSEKVSPNDMFNDARYGCANSAASSGKGNLSG
jgi:hypothetical protein